MISISTRLDFIHMNQIMICSMLSTLSQNACYAYILMYVRSQFKCLCSIAFISMQRKLWRKRTHTHTTHIATNGKSFDDELMKVIVISIVDTCEHMMIYSSDQKISATLFQNYCDRTICVGIRKLQMNISSWRTWKNWQQHSKS